MAQLKDFQCATVERIDELFRHGQNRVLVADEVGLGMLRKSHTNKEATNMAFKKIRKMKVYKKARRHPPGRRPPTVLRQKLARGRSPDYYMQIWE